MPCPISIQKQNLVPLPTTFVPTSESKASIFPRTCFKKDQAARLDRSLSWVVQRAWKISRHEINKLPSVNDVPDDDNNPGQ
jgi:uncharacterized small protein (TIGR04563 family)